MTELQSLLYPWSAYTIVNTLAYRLKKSYLKKMHNIFVITAQKTQFKIVYNNDRKIVENTDRSR